MGTPGLTRQPNTRQETHDMKANPAIIDTAIKVSRDKHNAVTMEQYRDAKKPLAWVLKDITKRELEFYQTYEIPGEPRATETLQSAAMHAGPSPYRQ